MTDLVSGPQYYECWLTVTLPWLVGTLDWVRAIANVINNTYTLKTVYYTIVLYQVSHFCLFFSPDDVYRRKRSEREYQQKVADGLIVLNEPAAK